VLDVAVQLVSDRWSLGGQGLAVVRLCFKVCVPIG